MRLRISSARICLLCLASSMIMGMMFLYAYGYRFNTTISMPTGIYQLDTATPRKGDMVALCLSDRQAAFAYARGYLRQGSCANGVQPLLKLLGGIEGDTITLDNNIVQIGNLVLPVHGKDQLGSPLFQELKSGVIPKGQAFVYTPHERSFDSRYVGLVPFTSLQRVRKIYP